MALSAEDIIIQVRQKLRSLGVKLWLEPYYFEEIGPNESELDILAKEFSEHLSIPWTDCKIALCELQDGAIEKLRARALSEQTGEVILKAQVVKKKNQDNDNFLVLNLKYPPTILGANIYEDISHKLECDENNIKIIIGGKVLQKENSLISQGIKNKAQAIILVSTEENSNIHERVRKAKEDAFLILSSKNQEFLTMEDQDGNLLHLPPNERNSIILALALYEKGRSALKRREYEEALVLFLESDEEFSSCQSEILNKVDNYALLNLDIVWCYLCLKSFSYLQDADRRLKICQENFERSYGSDMCRLFKLKGNLIGNERALVMRFHLLQGVLYYHQNKRNEAYEKLLVVESEISQLEIDEEKLLSMLNMGYDLLETKIALRACYNNINEAINFIAERKAAKEQARKRANKELDIGNKIRKLEGSEWVNPKSVTTLVEMGFVTEIAIMALKKTNNDLTQAIDLIQNHGEALKAEIPKVEPQCDLVDELCSLGFKKEMVETALKSFLNNKEEAIEFLLKLHSEDDFDNILQVIENENSLCFNENVAGPSTDNKCNVISIVKKQIKKEKEAKEAYERFAEDVSNVEDEYLDMNFVEEKNIVKEYKLLLTK
ncbi:NEDD8 ultimate buster 1-like [Condylostylus longicornis]|uniref:NEDD8 ultimate buster 1-like n=1 Tax=Condylostylus longicornis TaxID=2530218 RepID=UPI00244E1A56|nr:NEDD8 ultimate buster 1-like [Condylostylus longicornis]